MKPEHMTRLAFHERPIQITRTRAFCETNRGSPRFSFLSRCNHNERTALPLTKSQFVAQQLSISNWIYHFISTMSSTSDNSKPPTLLSKTTMPPCDNVYRPLIPHLLNNKLYYQIDGSSDFLPADLVTPKPTADDIIKMISNDHNAVTVAEDKVLDLLH